MTATSSRDVEEPPPSPSVTMVGGRPRLDPAFSAEHSGVRRRSEMAQVAAVPAPPGDHRVQYWTFGGVADETHDRALHDLPLSYDLTVIPPLASAWELAKTHGHTHTNQRGPGVGFAELYEVLEGRAGFLVQDLHEGPISTFAVLIEADRGDVIVVPPLCQHAMVNLGSGTLVVADVSCRASIHDYAGVRAARGMAYYIALDGSAVRNEAYRSVPVLEQTNAQDWPATGGGSLYQALVRQPDTLVWLCDPDGFVARYPELGHRVGMCVRAES